MIDPVRKYWGVFCPLPRDPGPYVHEIYPLAWDCRLDGGELRDATPAELDEIMDQELQDPAQRRRFNRSFVTD